MIRAISLSATFLIASLSVATAQDLRTRLSFGASHSVDDATSFAAANGLQDRTTNSTSARFMWDGGGGDLRFQIHSNLSFTKGDDIAYGGLVAGVFPSAAPATYFDLSNTLSVGADHFVIHNIDRLSATFTTPSLVLKFGRQAITWGNGMVFRPGDIVAAFSPGAQDTSYKPGTDMIYTQYLFDSGADVQAIVVPRSSSAGGPVEYDQSTYAVRAANSFGAVDGAVMFARDRADSVGSLALSGPLGEASWSAEYVNWALASGGRYPSWVVNVMNFSAIGEMPVSYFAEYYHNGFGVDASVSYADLPANLTKRMSTGQVFNAGENYLAFGGSLSLGPDIALSPNAMINVDDRSAIAGVAANYTLDDSTSISAHFSKPFGADETDFGGRQTTATSGEYIGAAESFSLRLVKFF